MEPERDMLFHRGKAYSQDLRERVFAAFDDGERVGQIAKRLRVSVSYVSKVLSRRRKSGETKALAQRCHVPPRLGGLYEQIKAKVAEQPDATLAELRCWLSEAHEVAASTGLMAKTLAKLDLTVQKNPSSRRSVNGPRLPRRGRSGSRNSRG